MLFSIFCLLTPHVSSGATAEEKYFKADVYYKKFLKDTGRMKYRDNWFLCIEKFQDAYKAQPSGTYASASLYMSGKLYQDLYKISMKPSDKKESLDILRRVVRHFPKSVYRRKAEKAIQEFSPSKADKSPSLEKTGSKGRTVEHKARGEAFKKSKVAYKVSLGKKIVVDHAKPEKKKHFSPIAAAATTITGLRFWSNPSYTRIVVDADNDTTYVHKLLEKDPSHHKPQRLCVDFTDSRLGDSIQKIIPINDDLLTGARAGQYQTDQVRVVVDIKSFKTYKIFSLRNPSRTIIDVWGDNDSARYTKPFADNGVSGKKSDQKKPKPPPKEKHLVNEDVETKTTDLAKQLALGVRRIVIDPGHGGKDPGAIGYNKRIREKNVVLSISKRLAKKIRRRLGCEVIMTRNSDRFLALEERTAIANTKNADLFISIHTNAHKNRRAYGIETYFLNLATDEDAIRVAARENATSRKNISDLETILSDLMQNAKINESSRLAAHVQRALYGNMKKRYSKVKNKGVKQAPFYVLIGAQMPAIAAVTQPTPRQQPSPRSPYCPRLQGSASGMMTAPAP